MQVPGAVARPTSDRVREALFSILGARVPAAAVLDLFAGSGALGLEALSRGAESAVFVDRDRAAIQVIRKNLEKARLVGTIRPGDVIAFLGGARDDGFDLIFADPPYLKREGDFEFAEQLMADANLRRILRPDGIVVLETAKGHGKTVPADGWELFDSRCYGDTEISMFRPGTAKE